MARIYAGSLALLALAAMLLAGCAGGSEEAASLSYEGQEIGSHEDMAECDEDGTVVATGHIDSGMVMFEVLDANGEELWSEEFSSEDGEIEMDTEHLEGDKGDWTVTATRTPEALLDDEGFDGEYDVKMTC